SFTSTHSNSLLTSVDCYTLLKSKFFATVPFRNSALLKTRTYLGLLTPCLALHGSQRKKLCLYTAN
ncbi:hypothetical protein, partial [Piscirickettsia salmonis]|uniref:hypothetical protein n=1 Tax=Piscirickettsia salmonis TaxID=1238 RepID=UPI0018AFF37D